MSKAAEKSILQFYEQWFGAMESRNVDDLIALLADDFYFKGPASPATSDRAALRAGLEQYHQAYRSRVDWKIEEVQLLADHAVVRISETVTLINRQTDETSRMSGVHLAVLKKEGDGWKLKTDVSSLNHPASTGP